MEAEITIAGFSFAAHKAVVICQHVFDGEEVLAFLHEDDGDLQAVCGTDEHYGEDDWSIVGLNHLADHHPELLTLPVVPMGYVAERNSAENEWVVCVQAD